MFSWDETKREKVLEKHSIDFAKIADIFDDPFSIDFTDEEHSDLNEVRLAKIGLSAEYGLIVLIYTVTEEEEFRFITARRAEKWMINDYERQRKRR